MFIGDADNSRVLVWNKFPTVNFQPADRVLGQPDFTCNAFNNDGSGLCKQGTNPSAQSLGCPQGITQVGKRLIVDDECNNRFLIYKGK